MKFGMDDERCIFQHFLYFRKKGFNNNNNDNEDNDNNNNNVLSVIICVILAVSKFHGNLN